MKAKTLPIRPAILRRISRQQQIEHIQVVANIPVGRVFEDVGQVFEGIQAVFLGGFDDAEHDSAGPRATGRVREQKILSVMFART